MGKTWNFPKFVKGDDKSFEATQIPKKDSPTPPPNDFIYPVEADDFVAPEQKTSALAKYEDEGRWYEGVFYRHSAIPKEEETTTTTTAVVAEAATAVETTPTKEEEKQEEEEEKEDNWKYIGGRWCRVVPPEKQKKKKEEEEAKAREREERKKKAAEEEKEKERLKVEEKKKEKKEREKNREKERERERSETPPPPPPPDPRVTNKKRVDYKTGRI